MATADQAWKYGSNATNGGTSYPANNQGVANTKTTTGTGGITSPTQRDDMNFMDDDYKIPGTDTLLNQPTTTTTTTPTTTTTTTNYGQKTGGSTTTNSSTTTTHSNTTSNTTGGSQSVTNATGTVDANTQANYDKYTGEYIQSQNVTDAYQKLQDLINNKPGDFNSPYTDQLNTLYNQIMQRDPFSYSVKDDALFDIYRQRYEGAGESAMKDVQGQYAANTGGYANSAGETAGYAAYQGYLNELQNNIPELYQMAYNRYKDQVDMDFNKYDITKERQDTDYQKYRDQIADWQTDRGYLQDKYSDERNFDYTQWNDFRDFWQNELWKEKESQWTTDETNWSNTQTNTEEYSNTTDTSTTNSWEDPYVVTTTSTTSGTNTSVNPGYSYPTSNTNTSSTSNKSSTNNSTSGNSQSVSDENLNAYWGYDKNGTPILKLGSTSAPTAKIVGYKNGLPVYDWD